MSGALDQDAKALAGARVLVLGRSEAVLETVLAELTALGIDARGTAEPEAAPSQYDARELDLITLGRGLLGDAGERLKARFRVRNPGIRFLDTFAPFAAHEIVAALGEAGRQPTVDLDAYCARIGYDGPRTPTLATLQALHEHHPAAIPFEAVDVLLDRGIDISPAAVDDKLLRAGRGGYCFEQNSLLKRALETIGFRVEGLAARVRWMAPPGVPPQPHSHMALRVMVDGTPWLADVGFGGCVLSAPLRLDTTEPQPTRHETFRVIPFGHGHLVQAWMAQAWQSLYELSAEPRLDGDYEVSNWYTATHPDSRFRQNLMVARTTPSARYTLLNSRFTVRGADGSVARHVLDAAGIERTLREAFQLPVEPDWRPVIRRAASVSY